MNVFVKFDEIPSMILQDIKETKLYRHTFVRSDGQTHENSIPSHKHSLRGYKNGMYMKDLFYDEWPNFKLMPIERNFFPKSINAIFLRYFLHNLDVTNQIYIKGQFC